MGEIDFSDLIARSKKVEENVLIDTMFGKIEVKPMYRRFRAVLPRDVTPGTTGGQDIQDAVEHRSMVGSWSPDMRFLRREMRLNDCPEIVIDFPECHTSPVLFKTSYNCGMTSYLSFCVGGYKEVATKRGGCVRGLRRAFCHIFSHIA
nr:hypothetical protein [Methanoculleus sp.]